MPVALGSRAYDIVIGRGVLASLGERAAKLRPKAKVAIVTDDNPRTEDSAAIIAQILAGMRDADAAQVIPDRAEAIRQAIAEAEAGDVVVVAGKGHEDCQIVGTGTRAFSDRETVKACLSGDAA